jgi:hypothetical protein
MSSLSLATGGLLPGTPLCIATDGHFCGEAAPATVTINGGYVRPRKLPSFDELQEQRRKEALIREDEEVLAAIMVAISRGLI